MSIIRRRDWEIPERLATPESVFCNRRAVLAGLGFTGAALAGGAAFPPSVHAETDPSAGLYPAPRNEAYKVDGGLTPEELSGRYNNFYEFGSHKQIAASAQALKTRPWEIVIDGMCDNPQTIAIDDLLKRVSLEERVYRHRCVEAWSMVVPWTGFPLADLVKLAAPQSGAKYVRFETFMDPATAEGQRAPWYPWPYVEGVTMAEAANELAFLVTGVYGKPLPNQFGAPLRLALPWKYGFKSIKSIVKVSFTDERPVSFWEEIQSSEYGFWANVNPHVPHPRWSQAMEQVLHTGERVPTLLYNGYGAQVADLYRDMRDEKLYM